LRPAAFAAYKVVSASCINASGLASARRQKAMPMLVVTAICSPSAAISSRMRSISLRATVSAGSGSSMPSINTTNSSPPRRAAKSPARTLFQALPEFAQHVPRPLFPAIIVLGFDRGKWPPLCRDDCHVPASPPAFVEPRFLVADSACARAFCGAGNTGQLHHDE
jgi:hypothetical protein